MVGPLSKIKSVIINFKLFMTLETRQGLCLTQLLERHGIKRRIDLMANKTSFGPVRINDLFRNLVVIYKC